MKQNSTMIAILLGSALMTCGHRAIAQPPNNDIYEDAQLERKKGVAEASRIKGEEAFDAGQFTEACRHFDVAVQLDPTPARKSDLFSCLEKLGQYATIAEKWRNVASTLTGQDKEYAEAQAKRLDVQAPCIIVDVPIEQQTILDMEVAIDGQAIPRVYWGKTCTPVNLGDHTITAKASKHGWPQQKISTMATQTQYRATMTRPYVIQTPGAIPKKRDHSANKAILAIPSSMFAVVGAGALVFATQIPNEEEKARARIFGFTLLGSFAVVLGTGGIVYAMAEPSTPEAPTRTGFSGFRMGALGRF